MNQITDKTTRPRRSFIFSPGLKPDMYPKALACGTDIVCVELEDGIAPKDKQQAREHALALFGTPQADDGVERIVRINCLRSAFGLADVQAVLDTPTPPPGLMLPKVVSPDEITWLDDLLTERGHDTRLHIIIETNAALESAHEIARASARVEALFFGGVDMAAELRCRNTWEPLLYARSRVVHAAAGTGIDVIDVPYLDLDDLSGMDVARKLLIMAREADLELELSDIEIESVLPAGFAEDCSIDEFMQQLPELDAAINEKVEAAKAEGKVLRYIGSIEDGKCKVSIQAVPASNPLSQAVSYTHLPLPTNREV